MADFILSVDLIVFAMVIACAASLLRRNEKRRVTFPHSDIVRPCVKWNETSGMAALTEREDCFSALLLMLPRLGRRAEQIPCPGIPPERPY